MTSDLRVSTLNPYAAPAAAVRDLVAAPQVEPVFLATGLFKLAILSVVTLSLYNVYWSYKNWKCVNRLTGEHFNAPLRAFFYPLTSYSLFHHIETEGRKLGTEVHSNAGFLAVVLFLLNLMYHLPGPYGLVGLLTFLPLMAVQSVVNQINRRATPDADPNVRLRPWNVVAVIVGGIVTVAAIASAFDPALR
jgi:hypothetical protein